MDTVLTDQERFDLVSVLRELDPSAPQDNRRFYRRKVLINLWIQRATKSKARGLVKAVLVNVSRAGVGFLARSVCERGEKIVIPLRFEEGGGVAGVV